MKTLDFLKSMRLFLAGLVVVLTFAGCGGTDICACLEEADKENPNQEKMDKCREAFSKMEMNEVQEAVEECGRKK